MYHVDINSKGEYLFSVKSKDYELIADIKGNGITPPDLLLASVGTCMGVYLRKYTDGAKIPIPEFGISVDADFSKEQPVQFRKINVNIDLKGAKIDKVKQDAIADFIKKCPVHNTLKGNPEIEVKIR